MFLILTDHSCSRLSLSTTLTSPHQFAIGGVSEPEIEDRPAAERNVDSTAAKRLVTHLHPPPPPTLTFLDLYPKLSSIASTQLSVLDLVSRCLRLLDRQCRPLRRRCPVTLHPHPRSLDTMTMTRSETSSRKSPHLALHSNRSQRSRAGHPGLNARRVSAPLAL